MAKKQKLEKNKETRELEAFNIKTKLGSLGLSDEMDGVREFYTILDDFVNNGYSASGKIKVHGTKRIISYCLTMRNGRENSIGLLYDANV